MLEEALEEAEDDEGPRVADVDAGIDRRAAGVDANFAVALVEGRESPGSRVLQRNLRHFPPHGRGQRKYGGWGVSGSLVRTPGEGADPAWVAARRPSVGPPAGLQDPAGQVSRRRAGLRCDLPRAPWRRRPHVGD